MAARSLISRREASEALTTKKNPGAGGVGEMRKKKKAVDDRHQKTPIPKNPENEKGGVNECK